MLYLLIPDLTALSCK